MTALLREACEHKQGKKNSSHDKNVQYSIHEDHYHNSLQAKNKGEFPLTGISVSGIPSTAATKIQTTSPIFDEIMYRINCLVLLYMALPSATAYEQMIEQGLDKYHLKITTNCSH